MNPCKFYKREHLVAVGQFSFLKIPVNFRGRVIADVFFFRFSNASHFCLSSFFSTFFFLSFLPFSFFFFPSSISFLLPCLRFFLLYPPYHSCFISLVFLCFLFPVFSFLFFFFVYVFSFLLFLLFLLHLFQSDVTGGRRHEIINRHHDSPRLNRKPRLLASRGPAHHTRRPRDARQARLNQTRGACEETGKKKER